VTNLTDDQQAVRKLLLQTFPQAEALPDDMLDALVRGEQARVELPDFVQPMDWTPIIEQVIKWLPLIANMVTIVKGGIDIVGAATKPAQPTVKEVAAEVTQQMKAERPGEAFDPEIVERAAKNALSD
jgi:hypothetical protein